MNPLLLPSIENEVRKVLYAKDNSVMKLAHKKIKKIDQCLIIQPFRGGNLLFSPPKVGIVA